MESKIFNPIIFKNQEHIDNASFRIDPAMIAQFASMAGNMNPIGMGLKAVGGGIAMIGQIKNQRETVRELKEAQENLKGIQSKGVESTLTPEMSNAMSMALKNYSDSQERAKYGFDAAQTAAYRSGIERQQTSQLTAAQEAGGGQMASYMGAVGSANKADNLLDMMSKDAAVRMQKEQFASTQLNPVIGMSQSIQNVRESDVDRYNQLLREAGKAVSDLRMQKKEGRAQIFNTAGGIVYEAGQGFEKGGDAANKMKFLQGSGGNQSNSSSGGNQYNSSSYNPNSLDAEGVPASALGI